MAEIQHKILISFAVYIAKPSRLIKKKYNSSGGFWLNHSGSVEELSCRDAFVFSQLWKNLHS